MFPHSPYAHVLSTNYVPSNTEINEIHSLLTGPCVELERLDAEIARLRASIDGLSKERDRVAEFVDNHKALVSPARRLPADILEEIFWHCLPTAHNAVMSITEAPLLLGRVCSAWRATLLCAPHLWSSLHIVVPMNSDASALNLRVERRCEGITVWLSRSGLLPLSISLGSSTGWHGPLPESGDVFIKLITPFSRRWRLISIDIATTPISLSPLEALNCNDFPLLENLALRQEMRSFHPLKTGLSSILQAPGLTKVMLANLIDSYHLLPLPRAQLTDLTILSQTYISVPDILRMLQQCPCLEACTLAVMLSEVTDIPEKTQIPALRTLRVCDDSRDLSRFFEALVVPELRHLTIMTRGWQSNPPPGCPFLPIISETDCLLESLVMSGIQMSHAAFVDCLSRMRRLTTLWVDDLMSVPSTAGAFIRTLIVSGPADCLCPSLDTIIIRNCCLSEEELIELLQSRSGPRSDGIATLRVADVQFDYHKTIDISSQLQTFHERGMQVTVAYRSPPPVDSPRDGLPSSITSVRDYFGL